MSQSFPQHSRRDTQVAADCFPPSSASDRHRNDIASRTDHAATHLAGTKLDLNFDPSREKRLAERTRIVEDLHDTLPGFRAASLQLHAAVDQLPAGYAVAKPRFSDVLQSLSRILERGRYTAYGLGSTDGRVACLGEDFAGVPDVSGFSSTVGYRVVVHGRQRELTAQLREEVYRIGCEAIVNAFRHSGARAVETEVEYRPTELRVSVRDDGCGINPRKLRWGRSEHCGLEGMRERSERIGARLRLLSRVALGTEVELCVPGRVAFEHGGVRIAC
jgi:signal transduction histidine kinase